MSLTSWIKGLLKPFGRRNKLIGSIVSKLDVNRLDSMPETYELLRRYTGDVYTCISMVASAVADGATPQLWVKVPAGQRVANFSSRRQSRERMVKTILGHGKSNVIDIVGTENVEQLVEHPILDLLLNPNKLHTVHDMWEVMSIYLDLAGVCFTVVVKDGEGRPVELWPIPPAPMRWKLNDKNLIDHFIYGRGTNQVKFSTDEVMFFRRQSPLDFLKGYGPLRAMLTAADTSTMLMEYERSLVENRSVPDLIMTVRGVLDDAKIERHRTLWDEQFREGKMGGLALIPGDDATITPLAWRPKDMENVKAYQQIRETICSAFGVPISMLTDENSNKSNAEAGLFKMAKFAIKPRLNRLVAVFNRDLVPMFDDSGRLFLAFPDPVPEDKELAIKERETNIRIGFSTPNEERDKAGLPPHPDGDELRTGQTMQQPSQPESQNPNDSASRLRSLNGHPHKCSCNGHQKALDDEPGAPEATGMALVLKGLFEAQRQSVLDNVDKLASDPSALDLESWVAIFALTTLPYYERSAAQGVRGGSRVLVERGVRPTAPPQPSDFRAADRATRGAARKSSASVNRTTATELRKAIREALARPQSVSGVDLAPPGAIPTVADTGRVIVPATTEDIQRAVTAAINKVYDRAVDVRADQVSRTETKRAIESARKKAYEASGVVNIKWVATIDERTCEFCREMNGRTVGVKQAFAMSKDGVFIGSEGGALPLTYGDIRNPPLHPNCRCTTVPVLG